MANDVLFDETTPTYYEKYSNGSTPTPGQNIETYDVVAGNNVTAQSANSPHISEYALKDAILALDGWLKEKAVWRLKDTPNIITSVFRFRLTEGGSDVIVLDPSVGLAFDVITYTSALTIKHGVIDVAQFDSSGNFVPKGTVNLGSNSDRWANIFCDGEIYTNSLKTHGGSVYPETSNSGSLGGASNIFANVYAYNAYVDTIGLASAGSISVGASLIPSSGGDLGSGGLPWSNIYSSVVATGEVDLSYLVLGLSGSDNVFNCSGSYNVKFLFQPTKGDFTIDYAQNVTINAVAALSFNAASVLFTIGSSVTWNSSGSFGITATTTGNFTAGTDLTLQANSGNVLMQSISGTVTINAMHNPMGSVVLNAFGNIDLYSSNGLVHLYSFSTSGYGGFFSHGNLSFKIEDTYAGNILVQDYNGDILIQSLTVGNIVRLGSFNGVTLEAQIAVSNASNGFVSITAGGNGGGSWSTTSVYLSGTQGIWADSGTFVTLHGGDKGIFRVETNATITSKANYVFNDLLNNATPGHYAACPSGGIYYDSGDSNRLYYKP